MASLVLKKLIADPNLLLGYFLLRLGPSICTVLGITEAGLAANFAKMAK